MLNEKKSIASIKSIVSALRKLELAILTRFYCTVKIIPKTFSLPTRRLRDRIDRLAYTPEQAQAIIAKAQEIDTQVAAAIEVGYRFGLRISCVLDLRAKDVQLNKMKLVVFQGKGGKQREVSFSSREDVWFLSGLVDGKKDMELLFPGLTKNHLRYVMRKACKSAGIRIHKFHNLRHSYAEQQMSLNLDLGMIDNESRRDFSKKIGHNRVSVTYSYCGPRIRPGWRN